jgi:AcrR family transcriptional regulator
VSQSKGVDDGAKQESDGSRRADLREAAIEYLRTHGVEDFTLASMASALSTSSRMLIYHLGHRDAILGDAVHAMRLEVAERVRRAEPASLRDAAEQLWDYYSARPSEMQLWFYLVGRSLEDPESFSVFSDSIVSAWTDLLLEAATREGLRGARAEAECRLYLAALRGLLLDLVITRDREAVSAAFRALIERDGRAEGFDD